MNRLMIILAALAICIIGEGSPQVPLPCRVKRRSEHSRAEGYRHIVSHLAEIIPSMSA